MNAATAQYSTILLAYSQNNHQKANQNQAKSQELEDLTEDIIKASPLSDADKQNCIMRQREIDSGTNDPDPNVSLAALKEWQALSERFYEQVEVARKLSKIKIDVATEKLTGLGMDGTGQEVDDAQNVSVAQGSNDGHTVMAELNDGQALLTLEEDAEGERVFEGYCAKYQRVGP